MSLAGVTIFVPTRRSARVLRSELVDLLGGRSAILPMIRALGETDDDSGFFDAEIPAILDLAPPLADTARLIELGRLILAWRNQLPKVVLDMHAESPLIAPASPADAIWLARNLAELIDAMETEELDWEALDKLDAGDHALWWQLTLEFLKIASAYWPERLEELKQSSPARHRNAILEAETQRIADGKLTGPIIIAGSTGSIPATAELIAAVQKLPNGTIVLPGLDQTMTRRGMEHDRAGSGERRQARSGKPQPSAIWLLPPAEAHGRRPPRCHAARRRGDRSRLPAREIDVACPSAGPGDRAAGPALRTSVDPEPACRRPSPTWR